MNPRTQIVEAAGRCQTHRGRCPREEQLPDVGEAELETLEALEGEAAARRP